MTKVNASLEIALSHSILEQSAILKTILGHVILGCQNMENANYSGILHTAVSKRDWILYFT